MCKIKFLVIDVDGTLTDGKIYIGNDGEMFKAFDVKDGYGIQQILPNYNIHPVIMTGRKSKIVEKRASELGIKYVLQGVINKAQVMEKFLSEKDTVFEEVAYIGDDLPDLEVMRKCAICGCPSNAVEEIKNNCDFISQYCGGDGAVREFIEWFVCKWTY